MNNYIYKKFRSNQKANLINIETNKILNYCKYFLLSINEYANYFPENIEYQYSWYLRSSRYDSTDGFIAVYPDGTACYNWAYHSGGFVPFFIRKGKI